MTNLSAPTKPTGLGIDVEVHKNVMHGQWKNCDFVLHVGSTAYVFLRNGRPPKSFATVVEVLTHKRWVRFRRGGKRVVTP